MGGEEDLGFCSDFLRRFKCAASVRQSIGKEPAALPPDAGPPRGEASADARVSSASWSCGKPREHWIDSGVDAGAEEGSPKHAGSEEPTGMRTSGSVKAADVQP